MIGYQFQEQMKDKKIYKFIPTNDLTMKSLRNGTFQDILGYYDKVKMLLGQEEDDERQMMNCSESKFVNYNKIL